MRILGPRCPQRRDRGAVPAPSQHHQHTRTTDSAGRGAVELMQSTLRHRGHRTGGQTHEAHQAPARHRRRPRAGADQDAGHPHLPHEHEVTGAPTWSFRRPTRRRAHGPTRRRSLPASRRHPVPPPRAANWPSARPATPPCRGNGRSGNHPGEPPPTQRPLRRTSKHDEPHNHTTLKGNPS